MRIAGLIRDRAEGRVILQMAWCLAIADVVTGLGAHRDPGWLPAWGPVVGPPFAADADLTPPHDEADTA